MNEDTYKANIIDALEKCNYLIHHDRPAMKKDGSYYTAIEGDAGFPDIMAIHRKTGYIVFVEIKGDGGKVSDHQWNWLEAAGRADFRGVVGPLWPGQWDAFVEIIRQGAGLDGGLPMNLMSALVPTTNFPHQNPKLELDT